ncbi:MAG: C10 family peptidase [Paludibacteraceae bacterium]|nr:C10 family peptidase [Paludibacteraceae bacterium]
MKITNHKLAIIFISFVLCPLSLLAAPRSAEQAAALASTFMNETVVGPHRAPATAASMQLIHQRMKFKSEEPAFYIFNTANEGGYVIVSADDRTEDILGYSDHGQLDYANINPNMAFWLRRLQEAISATNDTNAPAKAPMATTAIDPLLVNKNGKEITWYQEAPYNNLCPKDADGSRSLTGCVATAAAQVMYKWCYPQKGIGTHSYTWENSKGTKKTLTVDYENTTYDWENMLPAYWGKSTTSAQKTAVATLMYHAGVACDMEYSSEGSGAYTDDMANGLVDHFGYLVDKFITTYSSYYGSAFSPTEYKVSITKFTEYFNADLEAGRPIIMGGEDGEEGGHEFVCDGRDNKGKFHINWGWEGDGNGYFSLSALEVDDYNFSSNLDAIIGLRPNNLDTVHVTSVSVSPAFTTLKTNEYKQLTATIEPTNATDCRVTWTSSDPQVLFVNEKGLVRAMAAGKATITVTTMDGGFTAKSTITVTDEYMPMKDFELLTDFSTLQADDEIIIKATHKDVHYCVTNTGSATSKTSYLNPEQVQLQNGFILLPEGSNAAIFTLSKEDQWWILTTALGKKLGSINVKQMSFDSGFMTWTIDIVDSLATIASSNQQNGRILFNYNNGSPRFCNYTSNVSATMLLPQFYVRRHSKPIEVVHVTGVTIDSTLAQIYLDGELTLTCTVLPESATNKVVKWRTEGASVLQLMPMDDLCRIHPMELGETTVVVTTEDGGFTASCQVTVKERSSADLTSPYTSTSLHPSTKVLENGQILFLRDAKKYSVLGVEQ